MVDGTNTFVQERLDALNEIDGNIVSLLGNISQLFQRYSEPRDPGSQDAKDQFSDQTETIYGILSKVAIDLRKEVKTMDDNLGVYDKNNDNVMILPISVDQKNTKLGQSKMDEELQELDTLLEKQPTNGDQERLTN